MPEQIAPQSALELAGTIAGFARSLSDDRELLVDALGIAKDSIWSDLIASRRSQRGEPQ